MPIALILHIFDNFWIACRNMMIEAARIARGEISPLSELNPENFDAIIFPGGAGVGKNL